MCYSIYLSTTSQDDLSQLPSKLYRFLPITSEDDPDIIQLLDYPVKWYIQCQYGGCSCHFRHLGEGSSIDFSPPEDWCPEDADDVEATKAVYDLLAGMLDNGYRVDLIDVWSNTSPEAITPLDVSLNEVTQDAFRFFENYQFRLRR